MGIEKTASDRFFIVSVESKETTEAHIVDLEGVTGKYACMHARAYVCMCVSVCAYIFLCEHEDVCTAI
jgi:protease II